MCKIIVVGPAAYLEGRGKGQFIDSFDKVVRINLSYPVLNTDDYGTRTDILYIHISNAMKDYLTPQIMAEMESVPLICLGWCVPEGLEHFEKYRKGGYEIIPIDFRVELKRKLGCAPTTGLVAVAHLLTKYDELYLTGFDCYDTGHDKTYVRLSRSKEMGTAHDAEKEKQYLCSMKGVRIDPDSSLRGKA